MRERSTAGRFDILSSTQSASASTCRRARSLTASGKAPRQPRARGDALHFHISRADSLRRHFGRGQNPTVHASEAGPARALHGESARREAPKSVPPRAPRQRSHSPAPVFTPIRLPARVSTISKVCAYLRSRPRRRGEPDGTARRIATKHGAGVGAVHGHHAPPGHLHVRQEALVAAYQHARQQWRIESHGARFNKNPPAVLSNHRLI